MSNKDHSSYVYILASDLCIKIGISNDPYTRLYNINSQCREASLPVFRLVYFRDFRSVVMSRMVERHLHTKYKPFRFTGVSERVFGYTEMFNKEITESVILELKEMQESEQSLFDYDPFLHLSNFSKYKDAIFDEVFSKVITKESFGITLSSMRSYAKLDINNLCANIKYARSLRYDLLHMTPFSDSMTATSFSNKARSVLPNGCFDVNSQVFDNIMNICNDDEYTRRVCSGIRKKLINREAIGGINKTKFLILPSLKLDIPYNKTTNVLFEFKTKYEDQVLGNSVNCVIA